MGPPSLTETSLCDAYLYAYGDGTPSLAGLGSRRWNMNSFKQFRYFYRSTICDFLGFRSSVVESSIFSGMWRSVMGHCWPTFRESMVVPNKELDISAI
jgi:hypothetical protein